MKQKSKLITGLNYGLRQTVVTCIFSVGDRYQQLVSGRICIVRFKRGVKSERVMNDDGDVNEDEKLARIDESKSWIRKRRAK